MSVSLGKRSKSNVPAVLHLAMAQSAGLLLYRTKKDFLEVFLVHPGGPFWAKKDLGAWSIPKGEFTAEPPLEAAQRELAEETGFDVSGPFIKLVPIKQKGGKWVHAWAAEADVDPAEFRSNTFTIGSREYPEVDRADWFPVDDAMQKINPSQAKLIVELASKLGFQQK